MKDNSGNQKIEKRVCKKIVWGTIILLLFVSLVSVLLYIKYHHCKSGFRFINSDFACDRSPAVDKKGYAQLQHTLEEFISEQRKLGRVEHVSVYFRDLVEGPVFGIDEYKDFAPASLLKLPLALVYMVLAENNPSLLSEQIHFKSSTFPFKQTFDFGSLIPDTTYSVEELLRIMIAYSDNDAYDLLYSYIESHYSEDIIYKTYLELGILAPKDGFDEIISVRRYGSIFRALYNVSYVNSELSDKLLGWLVESTFSKGLEAGIPKNIFVANKFGERELRDGTKQLHDCGIVYYPENPYLLCIMTHGGEFEDLIQVISHISRLVYNEFDSRRF